VLFYPVLPDLFNKCLTIDQHLKSGKMNGNLTYKFVFRHTAKDRGAVYLRVIINRKIKYYALNVYGQSKDWNEKIQDFKKVTYKSAIISKYRKIIDEYIIYCRLNDIEPSFDDLNIRFKRKIKGLDFITFIEEQLEKNKHLYSSQTLKTYKTYLTKLKNFKYPIYFHDINENFIKEYRKWMQEVRLNNQNTINKSLSILKTFVKIAQKAKYIHTNPFENILIKKIQGNREFLTMEELHILEDYYQTTTNKSHKKVLRYFLFSCYTGLRFTDVVNLKYKNIQNGFIRIVMHKTKDEVIIPLSNKAKNLIENGQPEEKIFATISNQKTNKNLKQIMQKTGIQKHISFHCARHTFATISLTIGIPIEVVQKLLGHKNIKDTLIYAKVVPTLQMKEMEKWNNI
jgi:integrase/recombinase XerC